MSLSAKEKKPAWARKFFDTPLHLQDITGGKFASLIQFPAVEDPRHARIMVDPTTETANLGNTDGV